MRLRCAVERYVLGVAWARRCARSATETTTRIATRGRAARARAKAIIE
jgi:hypothetical protein